MIGKCQECGKDFEKKQDEVKAFCSDDCKQEALAKLDQGSDECLSCQQMAKLCPRGKAAAKRKFKVYPSAYANLYASGVCSGKITPGGKKKRTKKAYGGLVGVEDMTKSVIV